MASPSKQTMLDNYNTALNDFALSGGVTHYSTALGITINRDNMKLLMDMRDRLQKEISGGSSRRSYAELR